MTFEEIQEIQALQAETLRLLEVVKDLTRQVGEANDERRKLQEQIDEREREIQFFIDEQAGEDL